MILAVQWIVTIIAGALFVICVLIFPIEIFRVSRQIARRNEDRHISGMWVIGSLAGVIALACAPLGRFESRLTFWWIPFAAEAAAITLLWVAFRVTGLASTLRAQQNARRRSA